MTVICGFVFGCGNLLKQSRKILDQFVGTLDSEDWYQFGIDTAVITFQSVVDMGEKW